MSETNTAAVSVSERRVGGSNDDDYDLDDDDDEDDLYVPSRRSGSIPPIPLAPPVHLPVHPSLASTIQEIQSADGASESISQMLEPRLPLELIGLIAEDLAGQRALGTLSNLTMTSRLYHEHLTPRLYYLVLLQSPRALRAFFELYNFDRLANIPNKHAKRVEPRAIISDYSDEEEDVEDEKYQAIYEWEEHPADPRKEYLDDDSPWWSYMADLGCPSVVASLQHLLDLLDLVRHMEIYLDYTLSDMPSHTIVQDDEDCPSGTPRRAEWPLFPKLRTCLITSRISQQAAIEPIDEVPRRKRSWKTGLPNVEHPRSFLQAHSSIHSQRSSAHHSRPLAAPIPGCLSASR